MTRCEFFVYDPEMKDLSLGQGRLSEASDPRTVTLRGGTGKPLSPHVKITHLRGSEDPVIVTQGKNEWEIGTGQAREITLKRGEFLRIAHFSSSE